MGKFIESYFKFEQRLWILFLFLYVFVLLVAFYYVLFHPAMVVKIMLGIISFVSFVRLMLLCWRNQFKRF